MNRTDPPWILFVDDDPILLKGLELTMNSTSHRARYFLTPTDALAFARAHPVALVISDEQMPEMSGLDLLATLKTEMPQASRMMLTSSGPGVAIEAINRAGILRFLPKPCFGTELLSAIEEGLDRYYEQQFAREKHEELQSRNQLLEEQQQELRASLTAAENELRQSLACLGAIENATDSSLRDMLKNLAIAAECHDPGIGGHLDRVSGYSVVIAEAIQMSGEDVSLLEVASVLHDVGKIAVPDRIIQKPGALDEEERAVMMRHPEFGAQILAAGDTPLLSAARAVALAHHERMDGSGYPSGLAGEEIPLMARIVALADAFDAMSSKRIYSPAKSPQLASSLLVSDSGTHFDPRLVKAFLSQRRRIAEIRGRFKNGSEALDAEWEAFAETEVGVI